MTEVGCPISDASVDPLPRPSQPPGSSISQIHPCDSASQQYHRQLAPRPATHTSETIRRPASSSFVTGIIGDSFTPNAAAPYLFTARSENLGGVPPSYNQQAFLSVRPSTAPVPLSPATTLSQYLPPRRELPFAKPTLRTLSTKLDTISTAENPAGPQNTLKLPEVKPSRSVLATSTLTGNTAGALIAEKPKKAPAKRAAPRSRGSATARKKAAEKAVGKYVPTVEELLQASTEPLNEPTSAIDTQELLAQVDHATKAGTKRSIAGESETNARYPHTPPPLAKPKPQSPRPCATAGELLYPQEAPPGAHATPAPAARPDRVALAEKTMNGLADSAGMNSSILATDPNYDPNSDLAAYDAQPEHDRIALVESWMCEQLENPHFHTLVRDMECQWQRVLFGM